MYEGLKSTVVRWLRAPQHPPSAPAGSHESVRVFRASPRFLSYKLIIFYLSSAAAVLGFLISVGVTLFVDELGWGHFTLAALTVVPLTGGLFFGWLSIRIDYDLRYYIVTDRSLRVREGAFVVKEMTITYANVQNLRVVQGPVQRLFKIWDLKVDTAGGGGASKKEKGDGAGHSVDMAGIENAHEVRDLVLSYLRQQGGGTGLGDLDDEGGPHGAGASGFGSPRVVTALEGVLAAARGLNATAHDRTDGAGLDGDG